MKIENVLTREELKQHLRFRQPDYDDISISNRDIEKYESEGWQISRDGKTRSRVRRQKPIHQHIEDRIWVLLYKMGFLHLNGEGGAILKFTAEDGTNITNQLDALAIDEEVAVVIECKSALELKSKPDLQKDLTLLQQHRINVITALKASRPQGKRVKVSAVMVLWDVQPSEADIARARETKTLILDASALEYYEKLVDHTGFAARYQFLADIFADQEIDNLKIIIPAVEARIGKNVTYNFAISPEHLLKIAYVAHRARGEFGALGAYQRMVSKSRLSSIKEFIDKDGVFPTNIVINFNSYKKEGKSGLRFEHSVQTEQSAENIRFGWLHLPARYQAAWVIDGQHRLLGYSGHSKAAKSFLCVTAYDCLAIEEQSQMFIDINSKQKRVSGNLLTELAATLHWNSNNFDEQVYSIVSRAVQDVSARPSSPFFRRIKMADEQGSSTKCISLQAVTTALKKSGFFFLRKQHGAPVEYGPLWQVKPDNTLRRTRSILDGWCKAILEEALPIWKKGKEDGGFLGMNDGVVVSIEVLRSVFEHLATVSANCNRFTDDELIEQIRPFGVLVGKYFDSLTPEQLAETRKRRGIEGQTETFRRVQSFINMHVPTFDPPTLSAWLATRADEKMTEAYQLATSIEARVQKSVVHMMMTNFGQDRNEWWAQVPKTVRIEAAKRREDNDRERGDEEEKYLNFIDYRNIMLTHWSQIFQPVFAYGEHGNKDKRTEWLVEVNRIRNKVMHASAGGLRVEEFDYLQSIDAWLTSQQI